MNLKTLEILEEELVLAKATVHREGNEIFVTSDGKFVDVNGNRLINYCSGNFLGFDKNEISGGQCGYCQINNPFSCGNFDCLKQLEHKLADFIKYDGVGIFSSYDALCADIFGSLAASGDAIIYDECVNPSIQRGIRLCKSVQVCRCRHNDVGDMETALKITQVNRLRFIVVDGIYLQYGHFSPLKKICALAEKYDAIVVLDDSFGFLACGKNGLGSDEFCGVKGFAAIKLVNMQNALCAASGAFIASDKTVVELVKRRTKAYQYSPSITLSDIFAANAILLSNDLEKRLETLHVKANFLCEKLKTLGLNPSKPCGGIVVCSAIEKFVSFQETIKSQGFLCQFIKHQGLMSAVFYVSAG